MREYAGYRAPTRQHELLSVNHFGRSHRSGIHDLPALKELDPQVGMICGRSVDGLWMIWPRCETIVRPRVSRHKHKPHTICRYLNRHTERAKHSSSKSSQHRGHTAAAVVPYLP